jgi:hypothetical protein
MPITTPSQVASKLGISGPGARGLLDRFVEMGLVYPVAKSRPKYYIAQEILDSVQS